MSFRPDVCRNTSDGPPGCGGGHGSEPSRLPDAAKHLDGSRNVDTDELIALITRVGEGDVDAFTALYDCTGARVYGVALRVLRDPNIAQEATLEVYVQVWADAQHFDPSAGSPQAWLTTLTQRHAVNRVRDEPGRTARILGCDNGNRVGGCHYVLDEALHPMVCADGDGLNDWQRETIALAYYGGMTCGEVAEFLGVPLTTVTSRIRAGLTHLRESLRTNG